MAGLVTKLNGKQIQDDVIKDSHIKSDAAIAESKLDLIYPTTGLFNNSVRTDEARTVEDGVDVSFPYILLRDTVNGKTYKLYLENGTLVAIEVVPHIS